MALTDDNINNLNDILTACEELRLTDKEIRFLNYKNAIITNNCDLYYYDQIIILQRAKNYAYIPNSLTLIVELATDQGCNNITYKDAEQKDQVISLLAGGL